MKRYWTGVLRRIGPSEKNRPNLIFFSISDQEDNMVDPNLNIVMDNNSMSNWRKTDYCGKFLNVK